MMGYSRDSFYRFKELYETGGELALQELTRRKPLLANRTPPEIEAIIVALSLEQPAFGQIRIANEVRKRGHSISPAGRARGLAAPRSRDDEEAAQGARSQGRPGGPGADREPARRLGEGQDGEGGAWRVRERVPGLLRRAGHLLRRQHEGGRAHLPADLHRHLRQGRLRQALRSQDADHRGRSPERPRRALLRRARGQARAAC